MNAAARPLLCLAIALALAACHRETSPQAGRAHTGHGPFVVEEWALPAAPGTVEPDLAASSDGRMLLSWMNSVPGRRNALQYSDTDANGRWQTAPRTIAVGNSLVANWADTAHVRATPDGALWAQWLQKSADGGTSIALARSTDDGFSWSAPAQVDGGTPAEHGFVASWPASNDTLGVAWLAGSSASGTPQDAHGAHAEGGTTTLRSAVFDRSLQHATVQDIDATACDCCRTAAAMTPKGPVLVYRGAGHGVRDILATRFEGKAWRKPAPVHADGWKIDACPVNGPAVTARDTDVLVAWYTEANGMQTVQLARSTDAGDRFAAPVVIDQGPAVQGRVAVALDAQQAWVAWLREEKGSASLWVSRWAPDLSHELQRIPVAKIRARGTGSGYPQLALRGDGAYLVWTDLTTDGVPQLRGATVTH
jgi:hypothetical protein